MTDRTITTTHPLEALIDDAFERRAEISPSTIDSALSDALDETIADLNAGRLRVAEKVGDGWVTHQWIKKAVLLYFRAHDNQLVPDAGAPGAVHTLFTRWFDKVPLKFHRYTDAQFRDGGFRVVPPA